METIRQGDRLLCATTEPEDGDPREGCLHSLYLERKCCHLQKARRKHHLTSKW